ncbi:MAG: hypothetical protein Q6353_016065 [Candidatus Sigynarchaeum springense]
MLVPIITLSLVFVAIQAFVVVFLAKRAIQLKLRNLWFLVASFIAYIVTALFGAMNAQFQILLQPFGPLLGIGFTKSTFYDKARSNYMLVVLTATFFTGMTFFVKLLRLIAGDSEVLYLINEVVLFGVFLPAYAWLAKACFDASRRISKDVGIEPWIRKRYLLLGISAAFISLLITPSLFMGSMATFYTLQGFFCLLSIVVQLLVFSILNYLCWVMPPWFKRWLGTRVVEPGVSLARAGEQREAPAIGDRVFTTRETITIADYLGNMLAPMINKSPAAIKGLLLVTFQDEQEEMGLQPLSFADVIHAINHRLTQRLEQLGIRDADTVVKGFIENVTRNQSMLLMMLV